MKRSDDIWQRPAKLGPLRLAQKAGLCNARNMYWAWYNPRNFGDWIGPLIYEWRTGNEPYHFRPKKFNVGFGKMFFTAGSIMRKIRVDNCATVWGSGIIHQNDTFSRPHEILAVRGPRTRARCIELGYDCPPVYGDPGIILPKIFPDTGIATTRLGIIPHYVHLDTVRKKFLADSQIEKSVKIIDVRKPVQEVVEQIMDCNVTVSSSLHGLIISHAYGRPSAWVTFNGDPLDGDSIKFVDYYEGTGCFDSVEPHLIDETFSMERIEQIAKLSPQPDTSKMANRLLDVCPF